MIFFSENIDPKLYSKYLSQLSPECNLYKTVDWNHDNKDQDLYRIALSIKQWKILAPHLEISSNEILDIKKDYTSSDYKRFMC